MIEVVRFEPSHLTGVIVHQKQARYQYLTGPGKIATDTSWSWFDDGVLIGFGGIVDVDDGIGLWVLMTDRIKTHHMVSVAWLGRSAIRKWQDQGLTVYADIDPDFPEAARLAKLLGFEILREVTMPDGRTMRRMTAIARIS